MSLLKICPFVGLFICFVCLSANKSASVVCINAEKPVTHMAHNLLSCILSLQLQLNYWAAIARWANSAQWRWQTAAAWTVPAVASRDSCSSASTHVWDVSIRQLLINCGPNCMEFHNYNTIHTRIHTSIIIIVDLTVVRSTLCCFLFT